MPRRSVVLVDDHAMFRTGVRSELGNAVDVVAEAADVDQAVRAVIEHQPEVVLLDVHLPGGGGAEVMRRTTGKATATRFLALSVSDAAEDVIGTIRAGARGYVTKTITGPELVAAIERVASGDAVFSPGWPASCSTPSPAPSRSRRSTRTSTGSPSESAR